MSITSKLLLLLVFIQVSFVFCKESDTRKPRAIKGVLDLRYECPCENVESETKNNTTRKGFWNFKRKGIVALDGEWEFIGKTLNPTLAAKTDLPPTNINSLFIQVPGYWNQLTVDGKPIGGQGYAVYRLKILLPPQTIDDEVELSIKLPSINTAYRIYQNDKFILEVGKFGVSPDESKVSQIPMVVPLKNTGEILNLQFHVSNFEHTNGGIGRTIFFGSTSALLKQRENNLFFDIFLFGALSIIALYHFGLLALRWKDKSIFYFAIFCTLMAIRTMLTGEKFWFQIFPEFPWSIGHTIEYLTFYIGVPIFTLFIKSIFPDESPIEFLKLFVWWPSLILASIVLIFPSIYFTATLKLMQIVAFLALGICIYILVNSIYRKRPGAKVFFVGFLLFGIILINDILYFNEIIFTGGYSPLGFLIFIFSQAFILSTRSSIAYNELELLGKELSQKSIRLEDTTSELKLLTQNLEKKVRERTDALEYAKSEVDALNVFTYIINSLSNLKLIFVEISKYIFSKYNITGTWLLLPDEKREYLYTYKAYSYQRLPEKKYKYLMSKEVPLNEKGGMLYSTFRRQKAVYFRKMPRFKNSTDKDLIDVLQFNSFLQVPLISRGRTVGILVFSNFNQKLGLKKKEIVSIVNLCSQVAGVIETTHLLEKVNNTKQETQILNNLIKGLNENFDLDLILEQLKKFFQKSFGIQHFILSIVTKEKDKIQIMKASLPDFITEEEANSMFALNIPIKDGYSAHSLVLEEGRTVFLRLIKKTKLHPEELFIMEKCKYSSILMIPLILQNEPVGFLDLFNTETFEVTYDEITRLSILGEQLAGIINSSNLLVQIKEEKKRVELQKIEIEKLAESRKRLSLVGQMVAGIVHDIKNPISTIKALTEQLNSDSLSISMKDLFTNLVLKEMDTLNDLVYEILDFSKGKLNLELRKVNISEFLNGILEFMKTDLEYTSVESKQDYQFTGDVVFDASRMRRVIINLVKNSIEEMYDGKKKYYVKIITTIENNNLIIAIEDNGNGLPNGFEEKIFEAFASEGKANGTGLGLFMSKWIIEAHNGKLTFSTVREVGTTFYITIPMNLEENGDYK
ncbi:MAG: hypothetical protein IPL26_27490 [Leptospiraceae bacterium]|nr:hypothetical protein [Leptospiraceae bacterium]